jgi:hypothetical protein
VSALSNPDVYPDDYSMLCKPLVVASHNYSVQVSSSYSRAYSVVHSVMCTCEKPLYSPSILHPLCSVSASTPPPLRAQQSCIGKPALRPFDPSSCARCAFVAPSGHRTSLAHWPHALIAATYPTSSSSCVSFASPNHVTYFSCMRHVTFFSCMHLTRT